MRDCERGVSWSEGTAACLEREEGREEEEGGRGVDAGSMRGGKVVVEKGCLLNFALNKNDRQDGYTRYS